MAGITYQSEIHTRKQKQKQKQHKLRYKLRCQFWMDPVRWLAIFTMLTSMPVLLSGVGEDWDFVPSGVKISHAASSGQRHGVGVLFATRRSFTSRYTTCHAQRPSRRRFCTPQAWRDCVGKQGTHHLTLSWKSWKRQEVGCLSADGWSEGEVTAEKLSCILQDWLGKRCGFLEPDVGYKSESGMRGILRGRPPQREARGCSRAPWCPFLPVPHVATRPSPPTSVGLHNSLPDSQQKTLPTGHLV